MTTSDRSTAKVLRAWERGAATYDRKISKFERGQLAGGREWLGARARGRVLEVAIGTGRSLPHYPTGVTITGVDLSPAMLERARTRAAELGVDVTLRTADAELLPFDDGSFDTVLCALSLCTIPDPRAAIREMHRVLAPGGTLLLMDHIRSSWPPIRAGQWLAEQFSIRISGEHLTRRHRDAVIEAGFELVESERWNAGMVERIHAIKASPPA